MGFVAINDNDLNNAIENVKKFLDTEVSSKEELISALHKLTPLEISIINQIRKKQEK